MPPAPARNRHCSTQGRIPSWRQSTPAKCTVSCSVVFASWRQRVLPSNTRFPVQSYSSVSAEEYSRQIHGFLFSRIRQLAPKSTPAKYTVSCSVVFASWRQRVLPSNTRFPVQSYSSVGAKEYSRQIYGFLFSRIRQLAPKSTPIKYTVSWIRCRACAQTTSRSVWPFCTVLLGVCPTHRDRQNTRRAMSAAIGRIYARRVRRALTRRLHFTAGCTTGWVNYANERSQAALERSSQDADDVIRLTRAARRLCGR